VEAILSGRGTRAGAAAAARVAWATARTLGAEPLRRELELLAQRGRLELDRAPDAPGPVDPRVAVLEKTGLSAREIEVLTLVATGRTNRQIADELFITEKTAGHHVSNVLGKLGVASRVEAAALAHRLGILESAADSDRRD
jgi:DNA-binding NarL/FixJ family response regulator